jgi:hypothetical protein
MIVSSMSLMTPRTVDCIFDSNLIICLSAAHKLPDLALRRVHRYVTTSSKNQRNERSVVLEVDKLVLEARLNVRKGAHCMQVTSAAHVATSYHLSGILPI